MTKKVAKISASRMLSDVKPALARNGAVGAPERHTPQVLKAELVDGSLKLSVDPAHKGKAGDQAAFGSTSDAFQTYALQQLLNIITVGRDKSTNITFEMNTLLAMLSAIAPQNEMEAMLAAQMVGTHHLAMRQLNKHAYSTEVLQHEMHANLATKLMRTFTTQVEALARLRRGGEQVVKHVHVNEGGQAVIAGTVNNGRGG